MLRRVLVVVVVLVLLASCAKYTPGVDYERRGLSRVDGVDILWWKAQKSCQITIYFWVGDIPKGITLDHVDPRICGEKAAP